MTNSGTSPSSRKGLATDRRELAYFAAALAILAAAAVWFFQSRGYTLYYGDAEAHLNIARSVLDSRTPGPDQIGNVWLPVTHAIMLPLAGNDAWWRSSVAGAIPSAICFVLACILLFLSVRMALRSSAAAWAAAGVFALNPNVLYLASIPMSEPAFYAGFFGLLFSLLWFGRTGSIWAVLAAAFFTNWASLTRYEGWFLIPFAAAYITLTANRHRWLYAGLFGVLAALGPLAWLAHNWWYTGNALDFYNGPYSPRAIQGDHYYPGRHELAKAWLYFRTAGRLAAGQPAVWIGLVGLIAALLRRAWWLVAFCALLPAFYVWSMYGSGTPIFVPVLWPNSCYNTRYGLAAFPLLAVGAGALAAWGAPRWRTAIAALVVLAAVSPWFIDLRPEAWVCWKESEVNSEARRNWTHRAAAYMRAEYRMGDGILISFGDQIGILREAGIPIREALQTGNGPEWLGALARPDLLLREKWAVAIAGDDVGQAMAKAGGRYTLAARVEAAGARPIEIYRRVK